MAKVTNEPKKPKTVTTYEWNKYEPVVLELENREAMALLSILGNVGGQPYDHDTHKLHPRGLLDKIARALEKAYGDACEGEFHYTTAQQVLNADVSGSLIINKNRP
jgi:hypothetical protein